MRKTHEEAYTEYVTARQAALRRAAFLLCGDWHRADDLVQETITKLYVRWRRASAADNVDGYVHTMLVRTFLDEKRLRWSKVRLLAELPTDLAAGPGPDTETRLALREALAQVPPRQRAALVLRFYCDLSVEQTAEVLGCATGTVKSQTAHGLSALRRLLSVPAPSPAN